MSKNLGSVGEFFLDTVYIKTPFALNEESCLQMHEVISEFKLILLNLNNYSIAVKWFLSNYFFYFYKNIMYRTY
jgi:hypothetical protein